MFDVLVYLYETYYRPDACPNATVLAKKLSAAGFEEDEIEKALGWLTALAKTVNTLPGNDAEAGTFSSAMRIYAPQELAVLGVAATGFIQFLESAKILNPMQREIVIERALSAKGEYISLSKLKVIVLIVLWSQGKEPDGMMFDGLFVKEEDGKSRLLH